MCAPNGFFNGSSNSICPYLGVNSNLNQPISRLPSILFGRAIHVRRWIRLRRWKATNELYKDPMLKNGLPPNSSNLPDSATNEYGLIYIWPDSHASPLGSGSLPNRGSVVGEPLFLALSIYLLPQAGSTRLNSQAM